MELRDIIIEKIRSAGPLSFSDFMEMCLYYPESGYYSSNAEQIGKAGDFVTSPYFTSLFGGLIARQIEEMWEIMGREPFTILEYGAGPGTLCHDILQALKKNQPLYRDLRYCIIEKSASMRNRERSLLHEKVCWIQRIEEVQPMTGCVLSNELLDNFPVHQVVMQEALMEIFVDYRDGFTELYKPASEELKTYLAGLGVKLPQGFRTEINLEAIRWIRDIAGSLKKGFIITIDYGFPSSALYNEKRKDGTLLCYYRHHVHDDPYQHVGRQDITSHVNFSALANWGSRFGLGCSVFTHQANFLQALGLSGFLKKLEIETPGVDQQEKQELLHTFLLGMGTRLKVLIQQKGMQDSRLSGLQFAQAFV
jgi:SAM-dependent MidA family methyltransferase